MLEDITKIFLRDLDKLKLEIESFNVEENIWKIEGNIKNSSGNLCLHLLGNLNTYIGKNLGGTSYVRDREAEFNSKNIPKLKLMMDINDLKIVLERTFSKFKQGGFRAFVPRKHFRARNDNQFFSYPFSCAFRLSFGTD